MESIHSIAEAKNILFIENKHKTTFTWFPFVKPKRTGMEVFVVVVVYYVCLLHYKENEYSSREIEQSSDFLLDSKCKEFRAILDNERCILRTKRTDNENQSH